MRLTRRVPALVIAGLCIAMIASAATTATAAPKARTVKPTSNGWVSDRTSCPPSDGKVRAEVQGKLVYPRATIAVTVTVRGQVTDDAVLSPKLQVEINIKARKYFKDIDAKQNVTTKSNGAPAFGYTISFQKSTTTLTRKEVKLEVADAIARARKQETLGRDLLFKSQAEYWGKPGKCVTAIFTPNYISAPPKDSGITTGSLLDSDGKEVVGKWKLVKAFVGKITNPSQRAKNPDFNWVAADKADSGGSLVFVKLRATSKLGLDDNVFIVSKELGRVHVEASVYYEGNAPANGQGDIGQLTFGALVSFDATEVKGEPGVYALESDTRWSFPVQSIKLRPGSDCLDATINSLTVSSPFVTGSSPDMPKGDRDVIMLDPSNQWRFSPTFLYFLTTTETIPPTNPNNCSGSDYWSQVFTGLVTPPPPFTANYNYLDTVLPNGDINVEQKATWTRDLSGLTAPLLTGTISGAVILTPLPSPTS